MNTFGAARDIRDRYQEQIMALPGVLGSGIGRDEYGDAVIRIYLNHGAPERAYIGLIPHIEGVPACWVVTGPITAAAQMEPRP